MEAATRPSLEESPMEAIPLSTLSEARGAESLEHVTISLMELFCEVSCVIPRVYMYFY